MKYEYGLMPKGFTDIRISRLEFRISTGHTYGILFLHVNMIATNISSLRDLLHSYLSAEEIDEI